MGISERDVRHLEALAAFHLDAAARDRVRGQLERILAYMEQLKAIDTEGVEPTYHVLPADNVLRPDRTTPSLPTDDVLRNAPDTRGAFYRVPRFVGESEGSA